MATRRALIAVFGLQVILANSYNPYDPQMQSPLFNASDDSVLVLTKDNIRQTVSQEKTAFVVLFYLSWCGHCIRFAPVFQQFANSVQHWKSVVKIASINCAEFGTGDFCSSEFNVLSFPKIKLFEPTLQRISGSEVTLRSFNDPEEITENVLKFLNNFSTHKRNIDNWPNLQFIEAFSKPDLLSKLPITKNLPVLLIVEGNDSLLGLKVILDLSEYRDRLNIFRVNGDAYNLRDSLLPPKNTLPALLRIESGGEIDRLDSEEESLPEDEARRKFVDTISRDFLNNDLDLSKKLDKLPNSEAQKSETESQMVISEVPGVPVHYVDLYNGIRHSLSNEVGSYSKLNETQVDVVRRYFQILNDYFPFQNENAKRFVKRMTDWFNHQKSVSREDFIAIMKAGSEGYLPAMQPWKSCKPSLPNRRGYPCSLWLLFHTLTVSEYTHQHMAKKVRKYHSVLRTMRDYVKYFFKCTYCAEHFITMAANLDEELQYPNSSVVWLWKAHNKVNKRLAGDITEDPKHPKIQFPSRSQCPKCYRENNEWKEVEVVNFLKKHYDKSSIVKSSSQSQITFGLLSFLSLITYIL